MTFVMMRLNSVDLTSSVAVALLARLSVIKDCRPRLFLVFFAFYFVCCAFCIAFVCIGVGANLRRSVPSGTVG